MTEEPREPHQPGEPSRERAGGWVALALIVGLAVLLGAGYVAAYYAASGKVPRGTSVAGVDIGNVATDDAVSTLERELGPRLARPVPLSIDGRTTHVEPAAAGLSVDYEATVAEAGGGRSWHPGRLWDYFTGGDELDPVVEVDEAKVAALVERLNDEFGREPVNGAVTFTDDRVGTVDPEPGVAVDHAAIKNAVLEGWLREDAEPAEVELTRVTPPIDASDVDEAVDSFANAAFSGPVTLTFGSRSTTLEPRQFAKVLRMEARNGELVPSVDRDALLGLVRSAAGSARPVNASVRLVDGRPQVVPGKPGLTFEPDRVVSVFTSVLTRPDGQRTGKVEATVAPPAFTTADAEKLRVVERVSTFTTYYPAGSEYRNVNIGRAAELIDGTLLRPGDTFSLNDTVGERTPENGFVEGGVIVDGILSKDYGGGVSQMATTLFNAAFFAGLKDVEHRPHSFYISRYPEGREATVNWGSIDLKFQNDTPYGVLIHTWITPATASTSGAVHAEMYSTKHWDVEALTSERYNYRAPEDRVVYDDPDCEPSTGSEGFDVDVTRVFRKPDTGEEVRRETFHWAYNASHNVECRTSAAGRQAGE